jgi:hypothetical protein
VDALQAAEDQHSAAGVAAQLLQDAKDRGIRLNQRNTSTDSTADCLADIEQCWTSKEATDADAVRLYK